LQALVQSRTRWRKVELRFLQQRPETPNLCQQYPHFLLLSSLIFCPFILSRYLRIFDTPAKSAGPLAKMSFGGQTPTIIVLKEGEQFE